MCLKRYKILLLLTAVCIIFLCIVNFYLIEKAEREMYTSACRVLKNLPSIPSPYISLICYFRNDHEEYLVAFNGEKAISAHRFEDGKTVFFCGENIWEIDQENRLKKALCSEEKIDEIISEEITSFLQNSPTSIRIKRPSGRDLPLWIYPDDPSFMLIERENYKQYIESMVFKCDEENQTFRWTVAASEDDVLLHLVMSNFQNDLNQSYIHGWGNLPEEIVSMIFTSNAEQ